MKHYLPTLILLLLAMPLPAQKLLPRQLKYVDADSIVIWESGKSDLRGLALKIAPELVPQPVSAKDMPRKELRRRLREWTEEIAPALNLAGGSGDETTQPQAEAAERTVKAAAPLLLATGDSRFADALERAAVNALPAEIKADGRLTFEKRLAARTLLDITGMIYATDRDEVYVNYYLNSSTHIRTKQLDVVIDQLTAMPHSGRVKLRISGLHKNGTPLKLRLRIPAWARGNIFPEENYTTGNQWPLPTVYVNGREEFFSMERGYLTIAREWNSGDEVYFDLPFSLQKVRKTDTRSASSIALMRGPLLYSLTKDIPGYLLTKESKITEQEEPDRYSQTLLDITLHRAGDSEMQEIHAEARPYQTERATVWLPEAK